MNGQSIINSIMYKTGKIQVLTTDTNYRTMVLDWLNDVKDDISSRHPHWNWLEKTATFYTVADQMSYDRPGDMDLSGIKIVSLKQTESPTKLFYVNQGRFDELQPKPTDSSGNPYLYTVYSDAIRLWPVPNDAIQMTLRYMKINADDFTDGTDTSDIPEQYKKVILDGVLIDAFNYEPQWGNSDKARMAYEDGILRMMRDNDTALDDSSVSERHPSEPDYLATPHFDRTDVG